MNVTIKVIPHQDQRYNTPGDWWFDGDGNLEIRVSDLGNHDQENCIAFHEYFEAITCRKSMIDEKTVSDFDMKYEKERAEGLHEQHEEPGFDNRAPYREQHQLATGVELILGTALGVKWNDYDTAVTALIDTYEQE
jgi:hypothetical protein